MAAVITLPDKNMGMGVLVSPNTIFKRKFRWGLSVVVGCTGSTIEEHFVKLASRPNISIEETEINMKNGKTWIPGKASWETITVTFYDIVGQEAGQGITPLYEWLAAVYDFQNGIQYELKMGAATKDYTGEVTLHMYSGCGDILETWKLLDAWPQAINFGDLDYSSSEEATVELTLRYSNVHYDPVCLTMTNPDCCTPCRLK
jgi:hypothetical protein